MKPPRCASQASRPPIAKYSTAFIIALLGLVLGFFLPDYWLITRIRESILRDACSDPEPPDGCRLADFRSQLESVFRRAEIELPAKEPKAGVVLLHGMSDSPYSLRNLGQRLHASGGWVVGMRMPGHGTAPSGLTHATWEDGQAKMVAPDGLQWVKASDADVLIVDEDSGNDLGERKYALVIDPETMMLADDGMGYFLAMAGGGLNPRAMNEVSAYGGTFSSATSTEFYGTWDITGLVAQKEDGSGEDEQPVAQGPID